MKKVLKLILVFVLGISFIPSVFADEADLSKVASLTDTFGGSEKEIVQTDTSNTYKFYYKYVSISSNDFSSYVEARSKVDSLSETSSEYASYASKVSDYETKFKALIPTVSVSNLENWTLSSDGNIALSNLKYESGKHNGYVLAVAAVKDGDTSKVYIDRLILESTSATTLGGITYDVSTTDSYSVEEDNETTTQEVNTESNPNTGINDYVIYLVPISIILGSTILLKRRYS